MLTRREDSSSGRLVPDLRRYQKRWGFREVKPGRHLIIGMLNIRRCPGHSREYAPYAYRSSTFSLSWYILGTRRSRVDDHEKMLLTTMKKRHNIWQVNHAWFAPCTVWHFSTLSFFPRDPCARTFRYSSLNLSFKLSITAASSSPETLPFFSLVSRHSKNALPSSNAFERSTCIRVGSYGHNSFSRIRIPNSRMSKKH